MSYSDDMEDIECSNIIYGKRQTQPPEKYTDLIFLKGSNNGYCVGREIDQYERHNIQNESDDDDDSDGDVVVDDDDFAAPTPPGSDDDVSDLDLSSSEPETSDSDDDDEI